MPHFERSIFPWNWGNYPTAHKADLLSPSKAFMNARDWVAEELKLTANTNPGEKAGVSFYKVLKYSKTALACGSVKP